MTENISKRELSIEQRKMLDLMSDINFGRIENLKVTGGKPILDQRAVVIRKVKFGGQNGKRSESQLVDFKLKAQVLDFFNNIELISDGIIHCLEIKHGLPFSMDIEQQ
ncbi:MAG: hypothetical protein ACIAQZ_13540 [Sedimentisphaeraceae bacterium JB056]